MKHRLIIACLLCLVVFVTACTPSPATPIRETPSAREAEFEKRIAELEKDLSSSQATVSELAKESDALLKEKTQREGEAQAVLEFVEIVQEPLIRAGMEAAIGKALIDYLKEYMEAPNLFKDDLSRDYKSVLHLKESIEAKVRLVEYAFVPEPAQEVKKAILDILDAASFMAAKLYYSYPPPDEVEGGDYSAFDEQEIAAAGEFASYVLGNRRKVERTLIDLKLHYERQIK